MKYIFLLFAFTLWGNIICIAEDGAVESNEMKTSFKNAFELLERIGTDSTAIHKLDSTLAVVNKSLKYYPPNPNKDEIANYIRYKGGLIQMYIATGKFVFAETAITELLVFARQYNEMPTVVDYEYYMGGICDKLNKRSDATIHYQESTKVALELKNYSMVANSQLGAATAYNAIKDFEKAMNAARLTIEYGKLNDNNSFQIGSGWHLIGATNFSMEKFDEAISALEKAADYYEKAGNKELLQVARSSIDYILAQTGKADKVIKELTEVDEVKAIPKTVVDTIDPRLQNSYEVIKTQKMLSEFDAADKKSKLETLKTGYLEREADSLRAKIWYISGLSLLVIVALILLYARLRQKRKAEFKMTQKYIEGLESERGRISKELHDGVCNDLLAIEMNLRNDGLDGKQIEQLSRSRDSVREISHELLPPEFEYASIDEILSDYISRTKTNGVVIKYVSDSLIDWNSIEQNVAFAIYRIVQEALSNSIKHSGASLIEVKLSKTVNGSISVEISDNGCGMKDNASSRGIGLQTIKERVKSLSGNLDIKSSTHGVIIKVNFSV